MLQKELPIAIKPKKNDLIQLLKNKDYWDSSINQQLKLCYLTRDMKPVPIFLDRVKDLLNEDRLPLFITNRHEVEYKVIIENDENNDLDYLYNYEIFIKEWYLIMDACESEDKKYKYVFKTHDERYIELVLTIECPWMLEIVCKVEKTQYDNLNEWMKNLTFEEWKHLEYIHNYGEE